MSRIRQKENAPGDAGPKAPPWSNNGDGMKERGTPGCDATRDAKPEKPPAEAFQDLMKDVRELREYAAHFVAAKIDGVKARVRAIVLKAALGLAALLFGAVLVSTGIVILLAGLVNGAAVLFGDRLWAGQLLVGGGLLAVVGGTVSWVLWSSRQVRKKVKRKYEQRHARQRGQFGHDVHGEVPDRAPVPGP
ncbi:MAG TPA: hypothetical protein VMT52_06380 [Planctomycetota bacterium]|nr:hypothetical protein [Planctomycetota bacterium]